MTRLLLIIALGFLPLASFAQSHDTNRPHHECSTAQCHEDGCCDHDKNKSDCPCCDEMCSCDCCLDGTCGEGGCEDCDCSDDDRTAVLAPSWDQSQTGTSIDALLLA